MRPSQWVEVEIAIAAATPAPIAQMVSMKWEISNARLLLKRLTTQALDINQCFLFITASLICSPPKRVTERRTVRTSAAVGFEPTPTPEGRCAI